MAKETSFAIVEAEAKKQLEATEWSIIDLLSLDLAVLAVINIYMTNDICKGFAQDFQNQVSIVSGKQVISVFVNRKESWFKSDFPLCLYEDLENDINEILIIMQAAIDRLQL